MSPPFSSLVPDEFVPRDVPAPSRISTTFLSPRYRPIVKSKQTLFRATPLPSPAVSDSRGHRDDRHFRLYLFAWLSRQSVYFDVYPLWSPRSVASLLLEVFAIFTVLYRVVLFDFFFSNKIKLRDIIRDLSYVKQETLVFFIFISRVFTFL